MVNSLNISILDYNNILICGCSDIEVLNTDEENIEGGRRRVSSQSSSVSLSSQDRELHFMI